MSNDQSFSIGDFNVVSFDPVGEVHERRAGHRIHFCLKTDRPITIYGRLVRFVVCYPRGVAKSRRFEFEFSFLVICVQFSIYQDYLKATFLYVVAAQVPCKHIFCFSAAEEMANGSGICPLCGTDISSIQRLKAGEDKIFIDSITLKSFLSKQDLIDFKLECMANDAY